MPTPAHPNPGGPMPTTLTPADRFAADGYAQTLPYGTPYGTRWMIQHAQQIEGFAHNYGEEEAAAAVEVIAAAAAMQPALLRHRGEDALRALLEACARLRAASGLPAVDTTVEG